MAIWQYNGGAQMEQENEELEMQNNSNNVFDNFVNGIEEHPKEAGGIILGLLATLGITNFIQWRKRRKEQKRHEEVENLQKDALKKHDAQIRNYKELSEENGYLKKLNSSLCEALVESSEGGESDNEE